MQDTTTTGTAAGILVRLGGRRIALAAAAVFASIALVASLAVAPANEPATDTDAGASTELIAGPSWGKSSTYTPVPYEMESRYASGPSWS